MDDTCTFEPSLEALRQGLMESTTTRDQRDPLGMNPPDTIRVHSTRSLTRWYTHHMVLNDTDFPRACQYGV